MFEKFLSKFETRDFSRNQSLSDLRLDFNASGFEEFLESFAGCTFNGGLYRVHSVDEIGKWSHLADEAFPGVSEKMICFGYDWLGRNFALDLSRIEANEPLVLMLEPGTGEALEIPSNFVKFHNEELVNYSNSALASDFFDAWLSGKNRPPEHHQCIGYKKPLFLGGEDSSDNLEVVDMEVYWGIFSQLLRKSRNLSRGAVVDSVSIK